MKKQFYIVEKVITKIVYAESPADAMKRYNSVLVAREELIVSEATKGNAYITSEVITPLSINLIKKDGK